MGNDLNFVFIKTISEFFLIGLFTPVGARKWLGDGGEGSEWPGVSVTGSCGTVEWCRKSAMRAGW